MKKDIDFTKVNAVKYATCKNLIKFLRRDCKNVCIIGEQNNVDYKFLGIEKIKDFCKTLTLIGEQEVVFTTTEIEKFQKTLIEFLDNMFEFIFKYISPSIKNNAEISYQLTKKMINDLNI